MYADALASVKAEQGRQAHVVSEAARDARKEQLEHVAALDRLGGADFDAMAPSDA
jgi:hypothetical protein